MQTVKKLELLRTIHLTATDLQTTETDKTILIAMDQIKKDIAETMDYIVNGTYNKQDKGV